MAETRREVVVVTGAGAGVGRAVIREFAQRQACIGLIARGEARLRAAKREVEELGGRALVLPLDVSDADAVDRAAEAVEAEFGPLDVWVNNAMTTIFAPFSEITPDEFKRATEVTYLGAVYGTNGRFAKNEKTRPGCHCPGWLCPGLPVDSIAVGLLRSQARHCRVH